MARPAAAGHIEKDAPPGVPSRQARQRPQAILKGHRNEIAEMDKLKVLGHFRDFTGNFSAQTRAALWCMVRPAPCAGRSRDIG